jgi:hypothetical protein
MISNSYELAPILHHTSYKPKKQTKGENNMKISKRDRYSLNTAISQIGDDELRNLKFSLNFRWMAHVKKNHTDAALSAKTLSDEIRRELARRAQEEHLKNA